MRQLSTRDQNDTEINNYRSLLIVTYLIWKYYFFLQKMQQGYVQLMEPGHWNLTTTVVWQIQTQKTCTMEW